MPLTWCTNLIQTHTQLCLPNLEVPGLAGTRGQAAGVSQLCEAAGGNINSLASGSGNRQFAIVTHILPFPFFLPFLPFCVSVVNCKGEDGRPYLSWLVVAKLKNCFHYQVEGFSHANYRYHCECGIFINPYQLIWPKRKERSFLFYIKHFALTTASRIWWNIAWITPFLQFSAGEKEIERTNRWGGVWGYFWWIWGWFFSGFALSIFKTLFLNASQVMQVHISILTSFLQHQRSWSGFIDVFLSLYCVHFPFRHWENKVTFPTESILFYWFYFLKILIELEINTV